MTIRSISVLLAVLIFASSGAFGEDRSTQSDPADTSAGDKWTFTATPYIWAVGMDGDVGIAGLTTSVSDSFIDIVDDSDSLFAFMGVYTANKGRWTLFVSPFWAKIGTDNESIGPLRFDLVETITIVGFGGMYRVGESTDGTATFDLLAGARYTHLKTEFDFKLLRSRNQSKDWVDPFVGGVAQFALSDKWSFRIRGDIGGFDVGSDFTWHTAGIFGYKVRFFGKDGNFVFGYRALGQDYSDGSGLKKFEWDMTLHGPTIGLNIKF